MCCNSSVYYVWNHGPKEEIVDKPTETQTTIVMYLDYSAKCVVIKLVRHD